MSEPEIKTFETILADLIVEGRARMTRITNWVVGGVVHSILAVCAKGLAALYQVIVSAINLAFLDTSSGIYLTAIARLIGLTATPAMKTRGSVVFYRAATTPERTIPAGTLVSTLADASGIYRRFRTTEEAVLHAGDTEVTAPVEAEIAGQAWNVGEGTITRLVSSVAGVDGVRNDEGWLTREGADAETEEHLRARCQARWASFSYGGTRESYVSVLMGIAGVQTVTVDSLAPEGDGTVWCIITTTAPGGIPTYEILAEGQVAVDAMKPVEAKVTVKGPTPYNVTVVLRVVQGIDGGDAATIEAAVAAAVEDLFLPSDNALAFTVGLGVLPGKFFAAGIAVPYVANVIVDSPAADIDVGRDGLAVLNSLTVNVI